MPNVIIGAGEFLIIIADGQDNADELRTSFKLAKLGEEVTLKSPDKELVDHMIIPQLKSDISYGRVNGNIEYLTPSPLAINNVADIQIRLDIPTPTIAGGIYQNNIILDFTSLGEVHYKFNNRSKKDEYIYSGESITLTETTVICYWASANGYLDSPIQCETYFIDVDHSLPLLSVVGDSIDLFSFEEGLFEFGPNAEEEWPHCGSRTGAGVMMKSQFISNITWKVRSSTKKMPHYRSMAVVNLEPVQCDHFAWLPTNMPTRDSNIHSMGVSLIYKP